MQVEVCSSQDTSVIVHNAQTIITSSLSIDNRSADLQTFSSSLLSLSRLPLTDLDLDLTHQHFLV